jgi:hypothetical protein
MQNIQNVDQNVHKLVMMNEIPFENLKFVQPYVNQVVSARKVLFSKRMANVSNPKHAVKQSKEHIKPAVYHVHRHVQPRRTQPAYCHAFLVASVTIITYVELIKSIALVSSNQHVKNIMNVFLQI